MAAVTEGMWPEGMLPLLLRFRVELFAAAQRLKGEELVHFWELLEEVLTLKERP